MHYITKHVSSKTFFFPTTAWLNFQHFFPIGRDKNANEKMMMKKRWRADRLCMRERWREKQLKGVRICNWYSVRAPFFPTFTVCLGPSFSHLVWPSKLCMEPESLFLIGCVTLTYTRKPSAPPPTMKRQFSPWEVRSHFASNDALSSPPKFPLHRRTSSPLLKFLIHYLTDMGFKDGKSRRQSALWAQKLFSVSEHGNLLAKLRWS